MANVMEPIDPVHKNPMIGDCRNPIAAVTDPPNIVASDVSPSPHILFL